MAREIQHHDLKLLAGFGAPLDDEAFRARYFLARDVWNRLHTSGNADMSQDRLHDLVFQWELDQQGKAAAKPVKTGKAA